MPKRTACAAIALTIAAAFATPTSSFAQAGYVFSMDQAPYAPLENATAVPIDFGDSIAAIDLGAETFTFFGRPYTLTGDTPFQIGGNGFVQVNDDSVIIVVDAFFTPLGNRDARSKMYYALEGTPGNRVLKVEWRNGGFPDGQPDDSVNAQIWLHQRSGMIEIRMGSTSVLGPNAFSTKGPWLGAFIAPVTFTKMIAKCWIGGSPTAPRIDSSRTLAFPRMTGVPPAGTVYRMTPRAVSAVPPERRNEGLLLTPNPATDFLRVASSVPRDADVRVYDVLGRVVRQATLLNGNVSVGVGDLPASTYFVSVASGAATSVASFVKR